MNLSEGTTAREDVLIKQERLLERLRIALEYNLPIVERTREELRRFYREVLQ